MSLRDAVPAPEWQARVELAACYRLVALFGWDDLVFTHISARVPEADDQFLINPYGLFFEEITASSLVKVDHAGRPLMDTPFAINPAGFVIHSAVHEALLKYAHDLARESLEHGMDQDIVGGALGGNPALQTLQALRARAAEPQQPAQPADGNTVRLAVCA